MESVCPYLPTTPSTSPTSPPGWSQFRFDAMILKTLEVLGPLHGYGVARRIEETSKNRRTLN